MTLQPPPEDEDRQLARRSRGAAVGLPVVLLLILMLGALVYAASAYFAG